MPAEAAGDLVEEEMRLRKELSNARQELTTKKHTLEILRKEKDALEAQRPETLKEQVEDADAEIAELRKQLKEATGPIFGPVVTKPSPGRPGARSSAASGWGALINDAKSKTLDAASPVSSEPVYGQRRATRARRAVYARVLLVGASFVSLVRALSHTVLDWTAQAAPLRRNNFRAQPQPKPLTLADQQPPPQRSPLALGSSFSLGSGSAAAAATSVLALGN